MSRTGLAEQSADWLREQSKEFRFFVLIFTFALVVYVHGFLLRNIFGYWDNLAFYYVEGVISFFFGGPLMWFTIALLSYID